MRPRRALWPWVAAAIAATTGAAWVGYFAGSRPAAPREALQVAIHLPAHQQIVTEWPFTFSPDGTALVFTGRENGRTCLFRRNQGDPVATAIPGTDDGIAPFVSPDGRWIGFRARGHLMKVPAEGGQPFRIDRSSLGAVWLTDGTIVYTPAYTDGLFRVSGDGGVPQRLTTPDQAAGELGYWWPDVLPGNRFVIFTAFRSPIDRSRVGVLDLQNGEQRWVVDGGFSGRYAPTGHLLYVKGRRLFSLPFDPASGRETGAAVAVLDDVFTTLESGSAAFAVSRRAIAYVPAALGNPPRQLVWLDGDGRVTPATSERRAYQSVSLSPDGRRAAVTIRQESFDLWTLSLEHGTLSRLTTTETDEFDPRWSDDGRELFYVVLATDRQTDELYRMDVGKPDSGRPIWDERVGADTFSLAVSPVGRTLAFVRNEPENGRSNLYTRPLDGTGPARPLRVTQYEETNPSFSPDGRWIAYESDETGRPEIHVVPAVGGEAERITSDGGTEPVWTQGGLFYRAGDAIRVVRPRLAERIGFGPLQLRFKSQVAAVSINEQQTFDVRGDGTRVLAVTIPEESRPRQIDLLLDWTATLARQKR